MTSPSFIRERCHRTEILPVTILDDFTSQLLPIVYTIVYTATFETAMMDPGPPRLGPDPF